jgi:SAM-dependent methyltransferase
MVDSNNLSYESRVKNQIDQFRDLDALKKLPPIYQYWSQKYLAPILETVFGTRNLAAIYATQFREAMSKQSLSNRVLSIGAGDCKVEVAIAKKMVELGSRDFMIDCTDLSGVRLERGRELAASEGVSAFLQFHEIDLNHWTETQRYAGVMAHHTLHHIVELEELFARIRQLLVDDGVFVSVDMIGRNGHMRWPETLAWVERIWAFLPEKYKFNHQFGRKVEPYLNWDCSKKGFEGIRAQDILPLLSKNFSFTHFAAVGGIIDVFVERGYGHNFERDVSGDVGLIDFIQQLNETLIDKGEIKPTMLFAAMKKEPSPGQATRIYKNWTPEFCVRTPDGS